MDSALTSPIISTEQETITVRPATSLEEVEALRSIWSRFAVTDIDADIDYFMTVVENTDSVIGPKVLHIQDAGGHDLLVVARLQNVTLPLRIGYRGIGRVNARALIVSFDGILGSRGLADEKLAFRCLRQSLKSGEADIVIMRNIDIASERYAAGSASTAKILQGHGEPTSNRWVAAVPDTLDEFLQKRSAKTRSTWRRQDKALLKNFENRLRLRRFDRPEEMDELCRDLLAVASRSYQQGLGAAFSGLPMERAMMRLGLNKGWYRAWILYLDDRPVSFWDGMAYGDTFFTGTPGFDADFIKHSVGRFTMLRMMEDLCADKNISRLDFGQGEAEYKSAFGTAIRLEREILLISPRPRPMLLMSTRSLFSLINNQGRKFVAQSKWATQLKSMWRRSLASPVKTGPASDQD